MAPVVNERESGMETIERAVSGIGTYLDERWPGQRGWALPEIMRSLRENPARNAREVWDTVDHVTGADEEEFA